MKNKLNLNQNSSAIDLFLLDQNKPSNSKHRDSLLLTLKTIEDNVDSMDKLYKLNFKHFIKTESNCVQIALNLKNHLLKVNNNNNNNNDIKSNSFTNAVNTEVAFMDNLVKVIQYITQNYKHTNSIYLLIQNLFSSPSNSTSSNSPLNIMNLIQFLKQYTKTWNIKKTSSLIGMFVSKINHSYYHMHSFMRQYCSDFNYFMTSSLFSYLANLLPYSIKLNILNEKIYLLATKNKSLKNSLLPSSNNNNNNIGLNKKLKTTTTNNNTSLNNSRILKMKILNLPNLCLSNTSNNSPISTMVSKYSYTNNCYNNSLKRKMSSI